MVNTITICFGNRKRRIAIPATYRDFINEGRTQFPHMSAIYNVVVLYQDTKAGPGTTWVELAESAYGQVKNGDVFFFNVQDSITKEYILPRPDQDPDLPVQRQIRPEDCKGFTGTSDAAADAAEPVGEAGKKVKVSQRPRPYTVTYGNSGTVAPVGQTAGDAWGNSWGIASERFRRSAKLVPDLKECKEAIGLAVGESNGYPDEQSADPWKVGDGSGKNAAGCGVDENQYNGWYELGEELGVNGSSDLPPAPASDVDDAAPDYDEELPRSTRSVAVGSEDLDEHSWHARHYPSPGVDSEGNLVVNNDKNNGEGSIESAQGSIWIANDRLESPGRHQEPFPTYEDPYLAFSPFQSPASNTGHGHDGRAAGPSHDSTTRIPIWSGPTTTASAVSQQQVYGGYTALSNRGGVLASQHMPQNSSYSKKHGWGLSPPPSAGYLGQDHRQQKERHWGHPVQNIYQEDRLAPSTWSPERRPVVAGWQVGTSPWGAHPTRFNPGSPTNGSPVKLRTKAKMASEWAKKTKSGKKTAAESWGSPQHHVTGAQQSQPGWGANQWGTHQHVAHDANTWYGPDGQCFQPGSQCHGSQYYGDQYVGQQHQGGSRFGDSQAAGKKNVRPAGDIVRSTPRNNDDRDGREWGDAVAVADNTWSSWNEPKSVSAKQLQGSKAAAGKGRRKEAEQPREKHNQEREAQDSSWGSRLDQGSSGRPGAGSNGFEWD